ncbi:PD-(D/E)XK nuclease family protein [Chakrabartyella piscis]|uniref:PDDEXK-like family protein n=1 Tax=Chakrabartyella piscis TaxID=2918914 RepID=UPI002958AE71|nr:PD-(D/E)XK nuclease family protein [Chakrabartyella piscis]
MPNDFEQPHIDDKKALQNFLLDIDCLNDLEPWTNRFNLFDILKISNTEIRHSNMIAWLLDPKENHGLDVSVLKGFMESLDFSTTNIQDVSLIKYNHFKVYREWKNIDLLLISDTDKIVICIENKIFSGEHDNQLNRYLDTICNHYPNYNHLFVYLTPNGDTPSDSENWQNFAYTELIQIIETAMSQNITDYIYNYMHSIHNDFSFNTKKMFQNISSFHHKKHE